MCVSSSGLQLVQTPYESVQDRTTATPLSPFQHKNTSKIRHDRDKLTNTNYYLLEAVVATALEALPIVDIRVYTLCH